MIDGIDSQVATSHTTQLLHPLLEKLAKYNAQAMRHITPPLVENASIANTLRAYH